MRPLRKGEEPPAFASWKRGESEDWRPSWEALGRPQKGILHDALLDEQGCVCCYCGVRVARDSSHIEHLRPRSGFPELAIEYSNLAASCSSTETGNKLPVLPLHCGPRKADWFDEVLTILPTDSDCAERFGYTSAGGIEAITRPDDHTPRARAAAETIRQLGLDVPRLVRLRRAAIAAALDSPEQLSDDDIRRLIEHHEARDDHGRYQPMGHVVAFVLRRFVAGR